MARGSCIEEVPTEDCPTEMIYSFDVRHVVREEPQLRLQKAEAESLAESKARRGSARL